MSTDTETPRVPKRPSPCPHCGKATFRTGKSRKQHIRNAHTHPSTDTQIGREYSACNRINRLAEGAKDYDTECTVCEGVPTVHPTGLCGPCCFGEADTINGNW